MQSKKWLLPVLLLYGSAALYGGALLPILEYLQADLIFFSSVGFYLLSLFADLFDFCTLSLVIAFCIYGVYRNDRYPVPPLLSLAFGAIFFKHIAALIALSILNGSFDLTANRVSELLAVLLEIVACLLVFFAARRLIRRAEEENDEKRRAARILAKDEDAVVDRFLPFSRIFRRSNPLQCAALLGAVFLSAVRLIAFLADKISYYSYFAFALEDLPLLTLEFVFQVLLLPFIGYSLALGAMLLFERRRLENALPQEKL